MQRIEKKKISRSGSPWPQNSGIVGRSGIQQRRGAQSDPEPGLAIQLEDTNWIGADAK